MPTSAYDLHLLQYMLNRGSSLSRYKITELNQFLTELKKLQDQPPVGSLSDKLESLVNTHFVEREDVVRLLNGRRSWRREQSNLSPKRISVSAQTKSRLASLVALLNYESVDELITCLLNDMAVDPRTSEDLSHQGKCIYIPMSLSPMDSVTELVDALQRQLPVPYSDWIRSIACDA